MQSTAVLNLLQYDCFEMTNEIAAIVEIERLHEFISGWYRGEYALDAFEAGFADALHPQFVNIQPSGAILAKAELTGPIRDAHGRNPDFRITIEEPQVVVEYPGVVVATYIELQQGARNSAPVNRRRSTVTFETGPGRLVWRHLQETGLG